MTDQVTYSVLKTAEARRSCPRCKHAGPHIDDGSPYLPDLARCRSCSLTFTNTPAPVLAGTTGIEYLDRFLEINGLELDGRWGLGRFETLQMRRELTPRYAWAIPSHGALDLLAGHAPLVEMGAGGGYWAKLLRDRGVDVVAYDLAPAGNTWVDRAGWTHVETGGPEALVHHDDRALFLCWPPMNTMAADCLAHYHGDTVIYVGEPEGGCTASDDFFAALERDYRLAHTLPIPHWPSVHDALEVWSRRRDGSGGSR